MTVFERDGGLILIDAGLTFPHDESSASTWCCPISAMSPTRAIGAVVLTHGHEDHIGALPYLLREVRATEVWGTRLTLGLVKSKLDEHGLLATPSWSRSTRSGGRRARPVPARVRAHHALGSGRGRHRAAHRVRAHRAHRRLQAGRDPDRRRAPTSAARRRWAGGVALLMADSTNAERPGNTRSERVVGPSMRQIVPTPAGGSS